MNRHLMVAAATLAASLAFCASALGAPVLEFSEAVHQPEAVHVGDEFVAYQAKVANIGDQPTTSTPLTVSMGVPSGLEMFEGDGTGWNCDIAAKTCSTTTPIAPGAESSPLLFKFWVYPDVVSDVIDAAFSASGAGASGEATATDVLALGPEALFGIEGLSARSEDEAGLDFTEAGGHPFSATSAFSMPTRLSPQGDPSPVENIRDLSFDLPAGFVGNPEAIPATCSVAEVAESRCSPRAAVGGVQIGSNLPVAIYRVEAQEGYPAAFAFRPISASFVTFVLRTKVRTNGDYGITAVAPLPPQNPVEFTRLTFATLCGFGADADSNGLYHGCKSPGQTGSNETPFLTNPTRCAGPPPVTGATIDSYEHPGVLDPEGFPNLADPNWKHQEYASPSGTDCKALTEMWVGPDGPSFSFQPDTNEAAAPAGYVAKLHVPQRGLLDRNGLGTAHLRDTIVRLPRGIALNPSAAAGLGACTEAEIGLVSKAPPRFDTTSAGCPEDSKIGTVRVRTPLLDKPLQGSVYLAAQDQNAVNSRFAIYLVVSDKTTGITVKLAGKVDPAQGDEGQITATFADNPQLPFEDFELDFFGGPRASLVNPDVCGQYPVAGELTPWSAVDPANPDPSEVATTTDTVTVGAGPGNGACPTSKAVRPFTLALRAGSASPLAGVHSPFTVRITRPGGDQEISGIELSTPPGFAAKLAGVQTCPDSALVAAAGKTGKAEIANPSCPAQSQVGTTTIGAGAGPAPYYVNTGKVYLTGPYKGAPLSLAFIVPAVAGPFDLGVQVVRTALYVDPRTAQITARSDALPQILDGVPLNIRDIRVKIDRPDFALNPTDCEAMAVAARVTGSSGAVADLSNRFQVGGCQALPFKPRLKLRLKGATRRIGHPALRAVLTARPGEAGIARAQVNLPHGEFLDQGNLNKTCTRPVLLAGNCPRSSVYGRAKAWTPLLDQPLEGNVYLVGGFGYKLPALVADLNGQIRVTLVGKVDSGKNKGIRNTFEVVPDAPVSRFELRMKGGKRYGLLENSENLCRAKKARRRAIVRFTGQNGKVEHYKPVVRNDCGKKGKKHKKSARHGHKKPQQGTGHRRDR